MTTTIQEVSAAFAAWKPYQTANVAAIAATKDAYNYGKLVGDLTLEMVSEVGFEVKVGQTLIVMDGDNGVLRLSGPRKYNLAAIEGMRFVVVAREGLNATYTVVDGIAVPVGG